MPSEDTIQELILISTIFHESHLLNLKLVREIANFLDFSYFEMRNRAFKLIYDELIVQLILSLFLVDKNPYLMFYSLVKQHKYINEEFAAWSQNLHNKAINVSELLSYLREDRSNLSEEMLQKIIQRIDTFPENIQSLIMDELINQNNISLLINQPHKLSDRNLIAIMNRAQWFTKFIK
jgi:hypothetical protein